MDASGLWRPDENKITPVIICSINDIIFTMLEAIILGIVQGLTEFIPVSSTAHLILIPKLLGWGGTVNSLSFDIALHGGTLLALLIYFRKDIISFLTKEHYILVTLLLATIPAGLAGVLLKDIVATNLRKPYLIAVGLVIFGLYMLASERKRGQGMIKNIKIRDAVLIGIAQAVALFPGVSRSGITISTALFLGVGRSDSARFSFLLSIPVVAGASLLELTHIIKAGSDYNLPVFLSGFIASAVTGFLTIKFLLWFFRRFSLRAFVYYRFTLAVIILLTYLM